MSAYDRAITVFSPDGQLLQVQYAHEAVRRGSPVVGIRGANVIVLAVEKKTVAELQVERTEKKIVPLDDHVLMAFAGVRADARVLVSRAQIECQSHRLTVEDPVTVEYITRYIAEMMQKYTQSNGRRPFGISCLIGGFDYDGLPHLFQTEPSGIFYEWKASSTGRGEKTVREYLEKNFTPELVSSDRGAVKLAIQALHEVVQSGRKNLDVAVLKRSAPVDMLTSDVISEIVDEIRKENLNAEKKRHK